MDLDDGEMLYDDLFTVKEETGDPFEFMSDHSGSDDFFKENYSQFSDQDSKENILDLFPCLSNPSAKDVLFPAGASDLHGNRGSQIPNILSKGKLQTYDSYSKQYICDMCSKVFKHQYMLTRHQSIHSNERKYKCETCGKAFRQMSTLSQHRTIHSNARPHVCNLCHKTFNRVSTLISHRKTHTDVKPHVCGICGKGFHQKGNLRNHIFTHTNARPYKCSECGKGFNQMSNLMCHRSHSHSQRDRHRCSTCGLVFQRRTFLRRHEEQFHEDRFANRQSQNQRISRLSSHSLPFRNEEEGMVVDWFWTPQLIEAWSKGETPYAELKPLTGPSVLVKLVVGPEGRYILQPVSPQEVACRYVARENNKVLLKVPLVAIIQEMTGPNGLSVYVVQQITTDSSKAENASPLIGFNCN